MKISSFCWFMWLVGGCLGFLVIQPAQGIGLQACIASWKLCYTFQITVEQKFCIKDSRLQGTLFYLSDIVGNYIQYVVKAFLYGKNLVHFISLT